MLSNSFKNILLPVDFTENLGSLVKQAIELVHEGNSNIHMLHVLKPRSLGKPIPHTNESVIPGVETPYAEEVMTKLQQWKNSIEETIPDTTIKIILAEGSVHDKIVDASKEIQPQLIIIGQKNNNKLFPFFKALCPNELARSTDCPVLTVSKNSVNRKIKNIVVPIRHFIPKRKMELIYVFAKKFRAKIHLVALQNKMGATDAERNVLLDTYRVLKTMLNSQIEYHLLDSSNLPKAALDYAEIIDADMIFVNPGKETKISMLTGRHINSVLGPSSRLKILTVEPYHYK